MPGTTAALPVAMSTTLLVTLALIWSFAGPAFAQANPVSGIVVDQRTGAPLAGVIVRVGPQQVLVESDANGHFALDLPPGSYELTFSIIGYALVRQPLTIPPGGAAVESPESEQRAVWRRQERPRAR